MVLVERLGAVSSEGLITVVAAGTVSEWTSLCAGDETIIADYHLSEILRGSQKKNKGGVGGAGLGGGNIEAFSSSARDLGIDYSRFHGAPEVWMIDDCHVSNIFFVFV